MVLAAAAPNAEAELHRERMRRDLLERGVPPNVFDEATTIFGKAVAVATITVCRPLLLSDYPRALFFDPGRQLWPLEDIWPLEPFAFSGRQGWSEVPVEAVNRAATEWIERAFWRECRQMSESFTLAENAWAGKLEADVASRSAHAPHDAPAQGTLFRPRPR